MALRCSDLALLIDHGFDDVIDVRSPAEWQEDRIPGAINLPVLDNEERARVGTIYKQVNPFSARKIGAALVARNAARHIEDTLADRTGGWRPLVYCWRGGQRSNSFAMILGQIGWRVEVLEGGYKTWRGLVVRELYETPIRPRVVVIDGNTGSAKTELLAHLAAQGVQTLDLEGMANHRGSLFGARAGGQPQQRGFESALAVALSRLDPARPVVVEAESSKVGDLRLPPGLWKAMQAAPRIEVSAPVAARAAYLVRAYRDLVADGVRLARVIDLLRPLHPAKTIEGWLLMAASGDHETLAAELMERHYDPRYARHRDRSGAPREVVETASLDDLPALAARVAERVARLAEG
ncbi:tRNA 2-selenouridine(34) synthase MnmH [Cereibacter sphaeroides]|uniref:tRNA 2-selenouridine(34) synthase MnmH n=1 Tax=Cereibacter sphaeroides TaxID=1063 RepID=UPI001F445D3A|nr:tRNA 2-selenouridine(34) synthase MnmH [Cereibacter sphaeroides]MCE6959117.1 tRNA 2-selenouridine(34) synthase MnmH [Cereibacter sphaeroides]MCE6974222.1 tRNA 2-selenouridine(34) synthase MnmH [Cereibacter sphaeroides]